MPALKIASDIAAVETAVDWIAEVGRIYADRATIHDMQIAGAEALNNIIIHGYRRRGGMPIVISFSVMPDHIALVLHDRADAMSPAALTHGDGPTFDTGDPATLPESGAGIPLMHACADAVQYRRVGQWNELILTFRNRPGEPDPARASNFKGV
jgi:anti-sigma regulatory factor (Ser/Thr protein kinase)